MTTMTTTLPHLDPLADLVGLYEALTWPNVRELTAKRKRAPEKERLYKARTRRTR